MTERLEQVLEAIESGKRFVAVQDGEVRPYMTALHELTGKQQDRPLFIWDESGLRSQTFTDELPETDELADSLDFLRKYPGSAAFLFDCLHVELDREAESLGRRFAAISDKLAFSEDCVAVMLVHEPLVDSLVKRVHWIGDAPSEAEKTPSKKEDGAAVSAAKFAGVRNLETFDSTEWYDRLNAMTNKDVDEIVRSGVYEDPLQRVIALRQEVKRRFAQKDEIVDAMFAAAVSQVPCVLMGPPGTAKGHMIRSMCEGLGLAAQAGQEGNGAASRHYFEYQLTRFTTPEEIFGPVHIQHLIEKQTYRRVTTGYLPTAQIAFLDEVFKASSAILNTLLSVLNERVFYNEGYAEPVPLTTIFAASNEPPQDESLAALFDRFPLRINCPAVDDEKLGDLMERSWEDAFDREFGTGRMAVPRLACANDLRILHKVSRVMFGGRETTVASHLGAGDFRSEFLRCFRALRSEASLSDRSLGSLYMFARANALLGERQTMTADDLEAFRFVRWDPSGELDRFIRNLKRTWRG